MSAQKGLHGRWFAGKMITATYMVYEMLPQSPHICFPHILYFMNLY
jgi:hypothetical protein